MKPMLAFHYTTKKAVFPCYAQPKLDGVRALWLCNKLISRGRPNEDGIEWDRSVLPHIFNALDSLTVHMGPSVFDGELYSHGLSLQQINRRVAVNRITPHERHDVIRYHIFDIPNHAPFSRRSVWLSNLSALVASDPLLSSALAIVPTTYINTPHEADRYYLLQRAENYEGAMYRDPNAAYGFAGACTNKENRWNRLLKRKAELDFNATIIGLELGTPGKAHEATTGSLILRLDNGITFNSGSGIQIAQRDLILKLIDELVANGTRVRGVYEALSDSGVPLRNRINCIDDPRF